MQLERAVRLMAMQEYRDGKDGDVSQPQGHEHGAPPRQVEHAGK
jgi:hypothetical protein